MYTLFIYATIVPPLVMFYFFYLRSDSNQGLETSHKRICAHINTKEYEDCTERNPWSSLDFLTLTTRNPSGTSERKDRIRQRLRRTAKTAIHRRGIQQHSTMIALFLPFANEEQAHQWRRDIFTWHPSIVHVISPHQEGNWRILTTVASRRSHALRISLNHFYIAILTIIDDLAIHPKCNKAKKAYKTRSKERKEGGSSTNT